MNLTLFNEIFSNSFDYDFLMLLYSCSVISGVLVVTSKNPIISILFLIALFLSIASYLMLLGLNFLGLSYLLVYVGAVSILFLFILMLINVRISELLTDNNNSIPSALIITIIFSLVLYMLLPYNNSLIMSMNLFEGNYVYCINELNIINLLDNTMFSENKILLASSQI